MFQLRCGVFSSGSPDVPTASFVTIGTPSAAILISVADDVPVTHGYLNRGISAATQRCLEEYVEATVEEEQVVFVVPRSGDDFVAVHHAIVDEIVVTEACIDRPQAVSLGDAGDRHRDFEFRGNQAHAGISAAVELLVEVIRHEAEVGRQFELHRERRFHRIRRIHADLEVIAAIGFRRINHDGRLVVQLVEELHVRIDREIPEEAVVIRQRQVEVIRGRIRAVLADERVEKRIELEAFRELQRQADDRVNFVPLLLLRTGEMRAPIIPDAGRQREVIDEAIAGIQIPENERERLDADALVFNIQTARRDVGAAEVHLHECVDLAAERRFIHGRLQLLRRRFLAGMRGGNRGDGKQRNGTAGQRGEWLQLGE